MKATLAEQIARRAHAGQLRRGGAPYIVHPEAVAKAVAGDPDAEAVAWLHDVIEDCGETRESLLAAGIPEHVVAAVEALTHSEDEDYDAAIKRAAANPLARKVKIADIRDNLASGGLSASGVAKRERALKILLNGEG